MADIQPVVHPAAHVDPRARLGAGVRVGPGTVIGPDVTLGDEAARTAELPGVRRVSAGQGAEQRRQEQKERTGENG